MVTEGAVRNWSILLGGVWIKGTRRDRVDFSPEERTLRVRLIGPALRHFYDDKYLIGRCLDLHALRKTNVRYSEASQGYAARFKCVSGDRKSGLKFPPIKLASRPLSEKENPPAQRVGEGDSGRILTEEVRPIYRKDC
jgi:hypothetical protein